MNINSYDYKKKQENYSHLKPCSSMVNEVNGNVIEQRKLFIEQLNESKSMTPQGTSSKVFTRKKEEEKNNKIKTMFSGFGNQMKNAINVFGEVKEQIKNTANEAKKNINYPFCKTPCNIENLKNTIYINEGEIVINKDNIYNTIFKKKKEELKKTENEDIFTCDSSDIVIKGDFNFGLDVQVLYENEGNKIVVHAYEKQTKKKIACSFKWKRVEADSCVCQSSFPNSLNSTNVYNNEYELTCDDIGYKVQVEVTSILNEQVTTEQFSKYSLNSCTTEPNGMESHATTPCARSQEFLFQNKNTGSYMNLSNEKGYEAVYKKTNGVTPNSKGEYSTKQNGDLYNNRVKNETDFSSTHLEKKKNVNQTATFSTSGTEIFSSFENTSFVKRNKENSGSPYGVAIAEIGPFTLNARTKNMLESIIHNDTIRYPLYIIKKGSKDEKRENELGELYGRIKTLNGKENELSHIVSQTKNKGFMNNQLANKYKHMNLEHTTDLLDESVENSTEHFSSYSSNVDPIDNEYDGIYMLYIYKNEIKIIDYHNKLKHMWVHKISGRYPYVEFLENNYFFVLHVSSSEYYLCKCLYKRHRDLITILLRYMHAQLYVLNDYIFNNINQNFEKNIFNGSLDSIHLNTILEKINGELLTSQKISEKYALKINSLQREKNMLEDELKNTIEAFQIQLDDVKKVKDEKDLINTNVRLLKEIKVLQEKYKNVDIFFKNKYKLLLNEIEKQKRLVEEKSKNQRSLEDVKELFKKIETLEKEKNDVMTSYVMVNKSLNSEKMKRTELERKMEHMKEQVQNLHVALEEEKNKKNVKKETIEEIEKLKKSNIELEQAVVHTSNEINMLTTEKNRLVKLVDSLTKDIEKSKLNGTIKNGLKEKSEIQNGNIFNEGSKNIDSVLKELDSLKNENELLKTRLRKFAKINKS